MALERKHLFRPGLYYIVLSDLCRSTEASLHLGTELNRLRIETFILNATEALGALDLRNYAMFVREIGDAVLILFSSIWDVLDWHATMTEFLDKRDQMWAAELTAVQRRHFKLEAKTVIHAGEVAYSSGRIPLAYAVNQVFKIEKCFKARELGITEDALTPGLPVIRETVYYPRKRTQLTLPGNSSATSIFVLRVRRPKNIANSRCT
jgi:hypothetical protein